MAVALKDRWFEDYTEGEVLQFGAYAITEDEILDFARRYDPQAFHLDHAAATASHFGGLVASGWMTASVLMRLLCDHFIATTSSMGSPGVDGLRWLQPVRPGDVLGARVTVVSTRRSQSKPDRGVVQVRQEAINQRGEVVLSMLGMGLFRCRPAP